jgi:hypothetical protein
MATTNTTTVNTTGKTYDSGTNIAQNWIEVSPAGANIFAIEDNTLSSSLKVLGSGDTIYIEGNFADFQYKQNGKTITLDNGVARSAITLSSMTTKVQVTTTLVFLDGSVTLTNKAGGTKVSMNGYNDDNVAKSQQLTTTLKDVVINADDSNTTAATFFANQSVDPVNPTTYTMTTAIETIPGSGTLLTGDSVSGVINGASSTFQTGDTINGSGKNAVNVTVAAASGEANGPLVALNNMGSANFRTLAAASVNAQLYTNVTTVASTGSTNVLTINNGALASIYALSSTIAGSADGLAIGIRSSDVSGTTTTANVSFNNVGTAAVNSLISTITTGIENVTIATTGTNNFTFTGNTTATTDSVLLTLTGSGVNTVTIGALATTSTINGSALTGALNLNVGAGLSTGDSASAGAGTGDVIRASVGGIVATGLTATGFETLRLDSAGGAATLAFTTNPGFTTLQLDANAAGAAAGGLRTLLNAGGFTALNLVGNSTTASQTANNAFSALTVTGGYTGAADTLTVTVSNGTNTLTAGGAYNVGAITTSGVENYVVNVTSTTANANTATFNGIADNTTSSLTVSANGNVIMGAIGSTTAGSNGNLSIINLSGVTGTNAASTLTVAQNTLAAASVITAGAGGLNATLSAESTTDVVTFTGGAGNDTLTANVAGANTLFNGIIVANGGIGNDTFLIGAGGAGAASSTITGGSGVDTFTYNNLLGNVITDLGTGSVAGTVETLTLGNTGSGLTATVTSNLIDTNTGASDTFAYSNAGTAANVVLNLASTVTTVNLIGDAGAGGTTINGANAAAAVTLGGSGGGDVITGGAFADTIRGNAGADTLTVGAGLDTFIFTTAITSDTVTDFSVAGGEIAALSVSALNAAAGSAAGVTGLVNGSIGVISAGAAVSIQSVAAAATMTAANIITLTGTTYANLAAAEAAIETGGNRVLTTGATATAAGNAFIVQWQDTTGNFHISDYVATGVTAAGATLVAANGTLADIAIVGSTALVAADFSFIA